MNNPANQSLCTSGRGGASGLLYSVGPNGAPARSPFALENETAYRRWRACKLQAFRKDFDNAAEAVAVADPEMPNKEELAALTERCRRRNFAFYRLEADADKPTLRRLWARLGLRTLITNPCADENGISNIETTPGSRYIPYTSRRLKWHTDGYYNSPEEEICAFAMHCVRPAGKGGENQYLDPEILYILLRDENPDYVAALMHPKTFIVPHDAEETPAADAPPTSGARTAAVLSLHPDGGDLVVRYTERRRHIAWRKDAATAAARAFIEEVLQTPSEYVVARRLDAGEGVVCNNVLHNRSGFTARSSPKRSQRLLYRARYHERVAGTGYATL